MVMPTAMIPFIEDWRRTLRMFVKVKNLSERSESTKQRRKKEITIP
jgi:hypothetical protein